MVALVHDDMAVSRDGVIDLSSATLAVDALLGEEAADGAGELVLGVPVVLRARSGGRSNAAIFETASADPDCTYSCSRS